MKKSAENEDKKYPIIAISNAIIDPNAMMVKSIHATVANFTVLAFKRTKRITMLAIEGFREVGFELNFFVNFGPFISIDDLVGRIRARRNDGKGQHEDPRANVQARNYPFP